MKTYTEFHFDKTGLQSFKLFTLSQFMTLFGSVPIYLHYFN